MTGSGLGRIALVAAVTFSAGCSGSTGSSPDPTAGTAAASGASAACVDEGEPFEGDTILYIEHNATDQDTGVHAAFNQDLEEACVRAPDGRVLILVDPGGRLGDLGINQVFVESREPPAQEYPIEELRADFPEGDYTVSGLAPDGTPRLSTARLTHDIPAAPVVRAPRLTTEEAAAEATVPVTGLVVRWEPVASTIDGEPVTVTGYQVIVTKADHVDPDAQTRPAYDVHLPPEERELAVADGFLEPGAVYELELIAIEESGNQTITVGFFTAQ